MIVGTICRIPAHFFKDINMQRRQILQASALGSFAFVSASPALAQNKPLRLVVPFPPGGATDMTARAIAEPLSKALGKPVIVENKAGAGGSIGMAEISRAAPDGLTLGLATLSTHGVNPAIYKNLPYDPLADFTPIAELVKAPGVLVVHPSLGVSNLAEFVKYLKAKPGKVSVGSPGNGTIGHMWAELFKSTTGTFMLHIPYRGAAPAMTDLLGGQVQVAFDQVASALAHIQSGKLRALAVTASQRLDVLPAVPTFAEGALFSNNDPSWFGLIAPKGLPVALGLQMNEAVNAALKDPALKARLAAQGLYASGGTAEGFGKQIRAEIEKFRRVAAVAKISLD
jgi:tripartite-type tricarboxylate transporter receptor subunit TctC